MTDSRRLYKSGTYAQSEVSDLLQALFIGEIISPSSRLWIVSPWITDFPVIDNRSLAFDGLNADWGPREVRLSEVCRTILIRRGEIVVVTRSSESKEFVSRVQTQVELDGTDSALQVVERDHLHEKGLLGDTFHLGGSMNLTYSGVQINDEALILDLDPDTLARARTTYAHQYFDDEATT